MAFTRHGHQIPGSPAETPKPDRVARCGSTQICRECIREAEVYMTRKIGTPTDYPAKAKARVREHVDQRLSAYLVDTSELPPYEVYLTDFSFILGGWKARVGTTMDDRMYYEVTYNFERGETYLTAFRRLENVTIPDKE